MVTNGIINLKSDGAQEGTESARGMQLSIAGYHRTF